MMNSRVARPFLAASVLALLSTLAPAQTPTAQPAPAPPNDLAEFEGHYEYRDGATLFMVMHGKGLVAILGESPYVLRPAGTDTFTNPTGTPIPFLRERRGALWSDRLGVRIRHDL